MSYGPNLRDGPKRAATYVDRIFRGTVRALAPVGPTTCRLKYLFSDRRHGLLPAVDRDRLAADPAGPFGGEEQHAVGDILRRAQAFEGDVLQ